MAFGGFRPERVGVERTKAHAIEHDHDAEARLIVLRDTTPRTSSPAKANAPPTTANAHPIAVPDEDALPVLTNR